jgi:60 kDa SS-A/Ro ribonucleoprotein
MLKERWVKLPPYPLSNVPGVVLNFKENNVKLNTTIKPRRIVNHEGGRATPTSPVSELRRSVMTCMLWEDTFYEKGSEVAKRIVELVPQCSPKVVAELAVEARTRMGLRHVPLLLVSELSRIAGTGPLVEDTLVNVIQRADELTEFVAIYWRDGKHPMSAGVKRGLAAAFTNFNAYQLAKYNRDSQVKLRDVMFLVHPKPALGMDQAEVWKKLASNTLESPDTWEVELSAGKDKRETFERLLREKKLGGLAVLRNLRNMVQSGVSDVLIRERLSQGISRAFPYRFVVAAKYAPTLEDAIEGAMFAAVEEVSPLPGKTGLVVDVSGSMNTALAINARPGSKVENPTTRIDVAAGLGILLRERCESVRIATFSGRVVVVPPRRGFALRDAIVGSQPHSSTYLKRALEEIRELWPDLDRLIVVTDEQSQDGILDAWIPKSYVINVAPYRNGVSYRNRWNHIDGWSERVFDYIQEMEQ